jgi:hypothetical protein
MRQPRARLAAGSVVVVAGLTGVFALAPPPPPSAADQLKAYLYQNAQTMSVSGDVAGTFDREAFSATLGHGDLDGGTNYDWAKLVLALGGWPPTDESVTVLTRWMRQENGPDNWFNRNNPLNNGWGSGGGGGTGRYPDLLTAAQNAAAALKAVPGYSGIVDALARSAPAGEIESAIWASPWATSHYANGTHWSHTPVPAYVAPDGSW